MPGPAIRQSSTTRWVTANAARAAPSQLVYAASTAPPVSASVSGGERSNDSSQNESEVSTTANATACHGGVVRF